MNSIFFYTDYRSYLADYYRHRKSLLGGNTFSYQKFADLARMKDKSCIYSVIAGKRNLYGEGISGISRAVRFTVSEAEYFETLVQFNQATNLSEQNRYFEKLCSLRTAGKGAAVEVRKIAREQFEFFSQWHHVVIRSIIDMYHFKDDYKWLAGMLKPKILPGQARRSVYLLERLGLVSRHADGEYHIADKSITTGSEVVSLAVQNFHSQCSELAKRAIENEPNIKRNITGLTLGISSSAYTKICNEIQDFQRRIMQIANDDIKSDSVYQLNFHFFPVSRTDETKRKADETKTD